MTKRLTAEQLTKARDALPQPGSQEISFELVCDEALTLGAELLAVREELARLMRERDQARHARDLKPSLRKAERERDEARKELARYAKQRDGFWGRAAAEAWEERDAAREALRELLANAELCDGWDGLDDALTKAREVLGDE